MRTKLRAEAKEKGLDRYFTGIPCKRGHVSERFTASGRCIECNKVLCSSWQKNNKECINTYKSLYQKTDSYKKSRTKWYQSHLDARREYHNNWYKENSEHCRQKTKERRKNPEVLSKHNKVNAEWRANNIGYFKQWAIENPEKSASCRKASKSRRRAREREAEGRHSPDDIRKIYDNQNGLCVYCGIELNHKYQLDHIIPLAKGGSNWPSNIQLLCDTIDGRLSCNQKKRDRDPLEFAQSIGLQV